MSVANIQIDASMGAFAPPRRAGDDHYYSGYPPIHVDVTFMIAANFTDANYGAGLAMLSRVITYFQGTPVLTRERAPDLPDEFDRIGVELVSLDFAELSHLMSATGARYVPLVLYRLRRLPFVGPAIAAAAPAVQSAGGDPAAGRRG